MAKSEMICPFSGKLCKECAVYRGRHYFLCYCKQYRGYVEKSESVGKVNAPVGSEVNPGSRFEFPSITTTGIIDPFIVPMRDINEQMAALINKAQGLFVTDAPTGGQAPDIRFMGCVVRRKSDSS